MFLSSLFEKYAEYSFSTVEKIEPFEKLILSIQHACKFLTYEHFNIIRGTDPILFKLIFIDTLLVPQFKIRYYDNDFANFLLNIQPDSEKFKRIMETFSCQRFYRPLDLRVYGSFSYMNMVKKDTPYFTWFPFYASMCEIKLLHGIILNFTDKKFQSLVNLPFKDTFKMNYSTTLYQIHIHLGGNFGNKMNELDELYQKGFLFQEKKYIIGKNEFKFKLIFNQIIKTSEKYKCDPIDFFLILNDHLKKQTSNQENQNVHQENQNPNQENQNSNQENQNVHQENQNVHQENQNVNQENQNPNQENQNVNQENHAFNPNHQILECPEVQTFRDIEAVISDPEFQIYFWKKLSNKYIKKINDLDVILAIKNCENSINEIENLMSRNLYNLMLYVTLNLNTTNFKTNEIDYNSTIFWKVLNEVYDFDQMKISNELVQCLEFDPTKVLLKQNEVEKLQIFMKNLFKVHYQTVVRFVPEIILMLKNRFKNIKKANDLELAVYNSFISIISKCKLEFSQFFCYYFKVADKNLNKMKRPPNYIREGWMYIYGLLNKFALKNNINLVQQFTEFFISD